MEGLLDRYNKLKKISDFYDLDNEIKELIESNIKLLENTLISSKNNDFNITIIAPMKAGKSSFINALIKEEILPNENEACTLFPIEIKLNSTNERIFRVFNDEKKEEIKNKNVYEKLHDDIKKIRSGKLKVDNLNRYILGHKVEWMALPKDININLIDLPGINEARDENNVNILDMFSRVLEKSNQIIYLFDIQYYKSTENVEILNNIKLFRPDLVDNIIFVLSKIDIFDYEKGKSIEDTKNDIKNILKQINIKEPKIIECSSKRALISNEIEEAIKYDKRNIFYNILDVSKINFIKNMSKRISKAEKVLKNNYDYISKNVELKKIDKDGKSIFTFPEINDISLNLRVTSKFENIEKELQNIVNNTKSIKENQIEIISNNSLNDFEEVTSVIKEESKNKIDKLLSSSELIKINSLIESIDKIKKVKRFNYNLSINADTVEDILSKSLHNEIRNMKVTEYYDTEWYEYKDSFSIDGTTPGMYKENLEIEAFGNYNRLVNTLENNVNSIINKYKDEIIVKAKEYVDNVNEKLNEIYKSTNIAFNNIIKLNFNENSIYSVEVPRVFHPYVDYQSKTVNKKVGWLFNKRTELYFKFRIHNISGFKSSCRDAAERTVELTAQNIYSKLSKDLINIINENVNQQIIYHEKMLQQILKDQKEDSKEIYDEIEKLKRLIIEVEKNTVDIYMPLNECALDTEGINKDIERFISIIKFYIKQKTLENNTDKNIKCEQLTDEELKKLNLNTLKEYAERGDSRAQKALGDAYYYGERLKEDEGEAFNWYLKSAKQGNAYAKYNVGYMYYYGRGVEQNYEEALKWYKKSAEMGYHFAQNALGNMYYNGEYVEQNYTKARNFYEMAAEQGNEYSQYSLGDIYYLGNGVEVDYSKAAYWYNLSAKNGYFYAQNDLGALYILGRGVKKDFNKAFELFLKSAEQGYARAQFNVAKMYHQGESSIKKNFKKAIHWYKKSAVYIGEANNNLAYMYYMGEGVNRDYYEAQILFEKAKDLNDDYAIDNLDYLDDDIEMWKWQSITPKYYSISEKMF